jgi:hypothetical protein
MSKIIEETEILPMLWSSIKDAGGPSAWARKHRIDRTVLSKVLHSHYPVTPSIIRALHLRRVYIRD